MNNELSDRCRLCANVTIRLQHIDESMLQQVRTLFQLHLESDDTLLPCHICVSCSDAVQSCWRFFEKVHTAQNVLTELRNAPRTNKVEPLIELDSKPSKQQVASTVPWDSIIVDDQTEVQEAEHNSATWETYPWTCTLCGAVYQSANDLRAHPCFQIIDDTQQEGRYYCVDCAKTYTKYQKFVGHVITHRARLKLQCDICMKWFDTSTDQQHHRVDAHHMERPYECSVCAKRFRMQSLLTIHARCHLPNEIKNQFACAHCPKRFGSKPNLIAHERIHAGVKDFTCDQCGKSFTQKGNLDHHMRTHSTNRPFSCTICPKTFKTSLSLRKHLVTHSNLKPHHCDICGKEFRERSTLREHMRIHTGDMPYSCEYCGKCFRFKGVLITHLRQHTGERPYSCLECQHHFANWPNYNKHMIRRHGINTSVSVRKPSSIPPTGRPQRNPPGTVLAPPLQLPASDMEETTQLGSGTTAAPQVRQQESSALPIVAPIHHVVDYAITNNQIVVDSSANQAVASAGGYYLYNISHVAIH